MGQPFKWFGPTIDEVGQLQQPSRMVWQAKYKKWKTNSAPAVAPTSTDGSPPRSAALSHKYKSDFTEILKNSIAEIQNIKTKLPTNCTTCYCKDIARYQRNHHSWSELRNISQILSKSPLWPRCCGGVRANDEKR